MDQVTQLKFRFKKGRDKNKFYQVRRRMIRMVWSKLERKEARI